MLLIVVGGSVSGSREIGNSGAFVAITTGVLSVGTATGRYCHKSFSRYYSHSISSPRVQCQSCFETPATIIGDESLGREVLATGMHCE